MIEGMLYPLIPKPIKVQNDDFSGKLLVDGNIISNLLLFRFQFDTTDSVSPICIQIEVMQKIYQYNCDIWDFNNPVMKTHIIKPKFSLKNHIKILNVVPLITFQK